jgi:hypothetical protein
MSMHTMVKSQLKIKNRSRHMQIVCVLSAVNCLPYSLFDCPEKANFDKSGCRNSAHHLSAGFSVLVETVPRGVS